MSIRLSSFSLITEDNKIIPFCNRGAPSVIEVDIDGDIAVPVLRTDADVENLASLFKNKVAKADLPSLHKLIRQVAHL